MIPAGYMYKNVVVVGVKTNGHAGIQQVDY
jgi:hypothetical protein